MYTWFLRYKDKFDHFVYGFVISAPFQSFDIWCVSASLVAGLAKEILDVQRGGKFSVADLFCTIAGGLADFLLWKIYSTSF